MTDDAGRLPRGRHKLSPEQVAEAQRARLLRALADVMAVDGYVDTPVAAILRRSRVSRTTFYELFDSKQDCFEAALRAAGTRLADAIEGGLSGTPASAMETFDRLLSRYLRVLASDIATTRLYMIETYAAGPHAIRERLTTQSRFVDGLAVLFDADDRAGRFACAALIAVVAHTVTAELVSDDRPDLESLHSPLVAHARLLFPEAAHRRDLQSAVTTE